LRRELLCGGMGAGGGRAGEGGRTLAFLAGGSSGVVDRRGFRWALGGAALRGAGCLASVEVAMGLARRHAWRAGRGLQGERFGEVKEERMMVNSGCMIEGAMMDVARAKRYSAARGDNIRLLTTVEHRRAKNSRIAVAWIQH